MIGVVWALVLFIVVGLYVIVADRRQHAREMAFRRALGGGQPAGDRGT